MSIAAAAARLRPIRCSPGRVITTNRRTLSTTPRLGYVATTNPNQPLGKKNASNDAPSSIALIGARGYTGSQLVELLNNHPYMDLRYVSSRELAGTEVEGYTKRKVTYVNLSPEELAEKADGIDCIVLALPNGVCKPFVDALDAAQKGKDKKTVVVDLSADYRFDDSWTYGLPELTKRSDIAQATRISSESLRIPRPLSPVLLTWS
jgi:N-acetyl-gamma-glutamyl-phosphate reductase/acetylglutamate kinase